MPYAPLQSWFCYVFLETEIVLPSLKVIQDQFFPMKWKQRIVSWSRLLDISELWAFQIKLPLEITDIADVWYIWEGCWEQRNFTFLCSSLALWASGKFWSSWEIIKPVMWLTCALQENSNMQVGSLLSLVSESLPAEKRRS